MVTVTLIMDCLLAYSFIINLGLSKWDRVACNKKLTQHHTCMYCTHACARLVKPAIRVSVKVTCLRMYICIREDMHLLMWMHWCMCMCMFVSVCHACCLSHVLYASSWSGIRACWACLRNVRDIHTYVASRLGFCHGKPQRLVSGDHGLRPGQLWSGFRP